MFSIAPSPEGFTNNLINHVTKLAGDRGLAASSDAVDGLGTEGMFTFLTDLSDEDVGYDDTPFIERFLRGIMKANKRRAPRSETRTRRLVFFVPDTLDVCVIAAVSFSPVHAADAGDLSKVGHWALSFRSQLLGSPAGVTWSVAQTCQGDLLDVDGLQVALRAFEERCQALQEHYQLKPLSGGVGQGYGPIDLAQMLGAAGPRTSATGPGDD